MKTGGIIKQTYFMKNLHGENLKSLKKLHVNVVHENISKFQMYVSETIFLYLSFYMKLSNIQ